MPDWYKLDRAVPAEPLAEAVVEGGREGPARGLLPAQRAPAADRPRHAAGARRRDAAPHHAPERGTVKLPLTPPLKPQLAKSARELPAGDDWCYEPKWDGFRTIVFRDGDDVHLQSRNGKPMNRYFPDVVEQALALPAQRYVLDGEMVVTVDGVQEFDLLSQRIHPAASRVERLAKETPAGAGRLRPARRGRRDPARAALHRAPRAAGGAGGGPGRADPLDRRPRRRRAVAGGHRRGRDRQAGERALPARRARGDGQDQARAHGRRGGGRVPLRQGAGDRRLADPRHVRATTASCTSSATRRASAPSRSASCSSCSSPTAPTSAARASRAAGSRTRSWSGRACARSWSARSRSTTSPASASGTGRSSCAGEPTRIRRNASPLSCATDADPARARRRARAGGPGAVHGPAGQPVRGQPARARTRSTSTGCATPTAGRSTA